MPVVVTEQYPKGMLSRSHWILLFEYLFVGLGATVPELGLQEFPDVKPVAKTQFSMLTTDILKKMRTDYPNVNAIVLCGIEAHVCVQGTALQAIKEGINCVNFELFSEVLSSDSGFEVHIVVDGCSSRSMVDRMFAFERMKAAGAWLTTSESVILWVLFVWFWLSFDFWLSFMSLFSGLVGDASHPKFKDCQKLIMESAPDSGLLTLLAQKFWIFSFVWRVWALNAIFYIVL